MEFKIRQCELKLPDMSIFSYMPVVKTSGRSKVKHGDLYIFYIVKIWFCRNILAASVSTSLQGWG